MPKYEWVHEAEWKPVRNELIELIKSVQEALRKEFTFQFEFIGSSRRNMITRVAAGNSGYDFDVDFRINLKKAEKKYSPKRLKELFIQALNGVVGKYGYDYCEDSTTVITIKKKDRKNSRIIYSCDIAIVRGDEEQGEAVEYILHNKRTKQYQWAERSMEYRGLEEKAESIKEAGRWDEVRSVYLDKKNQFSPGKKSKALYAETINEMFDRLTEKPDTLHEFANYGLMNVVVVKNVVKGRKW